MTPKEFGSLCAATGQASIGAGFNPTKKNIPAPIARGLDKPIVLKLPYPPSANRYVRTRVVQKKGRAPFVLTYPSADAVAFKKQVLSICRRAGIVEPIDGRIELEYWLYPQCPKDAAKRKKKDPLNWDDDVRSIDLDNAQKVLLDSLKNIAFKDDKFVRTIHADRMEPDGEARLVVRISKWEP